MHYARSCVALIALLARRQLSAVRDGQLTADADHFEARGGKIKAFCVESFNCLDGEAGARTRHRSLDHLAIKKYVLNRNARRTELTS